RYGSVIDGEYSSCGGLSTDFSLARVVAVSSTKVGRLAFTGDDSSVEDSRVSSVLAETNGKGSSGISSSKISPSISNLPEVGSGSAGPPWSENEFARSIS